MKVTKIDLMFYRQQLISSRKLLDGQELQKVSVHDCINSRSDCVFIPKTGRGSRYERHNTYSNVRSVLKRCNTSEDRLSALIGINGRPDTRRRSVVNKVITKLQLTNFKTNSK